MNKLKILFMGRKQVAANCLRYVCQNPNVEVVGVLTDNHLAISPTTALAKELNLSVFNFSEVLQKLSSGDLKFDLGLSMLYWRKLRGDFLSVPSLGIINFHPAPLPDYKGTAGYNLAILEGRDTWATSAHYIDESIDTGPIIEVDTFPISVDEETAQSLEKKSQHFLEAQFIRTFDRVATSRELLPVTPNLGGRYVSRAEMEAMKEVQSNDDVSRKIRAFWFPPYDGAYINVNGVKCTIIDRFILDQLADKTSSSLFTQGSMGD